LVKFSPNFVQNFSTYTRVYTVTFVSGFEKQRNLDLAHSFSNVFSQVIVSLSTDLSGCRSVWLADILQQLTKPTSLVHLANEMEHQVKNGSSINDVTLDKKETFSRGKQNFLKKGQIH
jgi:hypothetical protein